MEKCSGGALQMFTTAMIGFSLAAGLIAAPGATERRAGRGVPSGIPTGLAATRFLFAVGVYFVRRNISRSSGNQVGVELALILTLVTAMIQTIVLAMGLASRQDVDNDARVSTRFV